MKKLASIMVVLSLIAGLFIPCNAYAAEDLTSLFKNQGKSRQEIINRYIKPVTNGSVYATKPVFETPYSSGAITAQAVTNGLNALNFARYLAGLYDSVTTVADDNQRAMDGAYLCAFNGSLNHYPSQPAGVPDDLYNSGYSGCSNSNLHYSGSSVMVETQDDYLVDSVLSWLDDSDASNISKLGHRRWIIDPRMTTTGFGVSGREEKMGGFYRTYSSMISFDSNRSGEKRDMVCWPAAGYFPMEFFKKTSAWSVSLNSSKYSKYSTSNISVTVTDNAGNSETMDSSSGTFYVSNDGYGMDYCIIFRPETGAVNGREYHVKITGLVPVSGSGMSDTIEYDVCFFSLDQSEKDVNLSFSPSSITTGTLNDRDVTVKVGASSNGVYIPGVSVTLSTGQTAVTDDSGYASFNINTAGLSSITATSRGGYIAGGNYKNSATSTPLSIERCAVLSVPFESTARMTSFYGPYYEISGTPGATVAVTMSSAVLNSQLSLYDISFNQIAVNDDYVDGSSDAKLTFKLPQSGTYFIRAEQVSDGGYYYLSNYTLKGEYIASELKISSQSLSLNVGESSKLTVTTADDISIPAQWGSSNTGVATVDSNGNVTAVAPGSATITASAGSKTISCLVNVTQTVVNSTSVDITLSDVSINIDETLTLNAAVYPENTTNKTLTWTSGNTSVVTVNSSGMLTPVAQGTAVITASNGSCSDTCNVTVTAYAKSVSLDKPSVSLVIGNSTKLTATVTPKNADGAVAWKSSNNSVATVDSNGNVTAIAVGKAVITATVGSKNAVCNVTVTKIDTAGAPEIIRLGGSSRYMTSVAIAKRGWGGASTVILANGLNYADALCGVPLASFINAPILLTSGKGNELEPEILAQIKALNPNTIIILGGAGVISKGIERSLKGEYDVNRISGASRYETSISVAEYLDAAKTEKSSTFFAVTGTGYADALSISPYAGSIYCPIIYVNSALGLQPCTEKYIDGAEKCYVIGGPGAVSSGIVKSLTELGISCSRISGSDRFDTCYRIAVMSDDLLFGSKHDVMLATGMNFPDALAGGVLAAKLRIPVLLTNNAELSPAIAQYITSSGAKKVYITGGAGIIPNKTVLNLF